MSANPQWDISRALGVARLFHLVCAVRDGCVTPFLTLYLRQLGLTAPWVGILMGSKHLVTAFWAPFCAFLAKSYQKRRVLLIGSLLGSVGASLLMVLIPPQDKDLASHSCNGSNRMATTGVPLGVTRMVNITRAPESASPHQVGLPNRLVGKRPGILAASGIRTGPADKGDPEPHRHRPSHVVDTVEGPGTTSQAPSLLHHRSSFGEVSTAGPVPPEGPELGQPSNVSAAGREKALALALSLGGLRWTFIFSLGTLVFWELLSAPLEPVADDSLYEYLDFVDATDRYRSLWVWRLLGTSAGVCGIAALVGQMDCYLVTRGPRGVVHFYGYSLVSTLALLVSTAFPIPTCRWREPSHRTIKALSLLGASPRLLLLAFTAFLAGAAASTVQNFLFWHMEDHGSSELVMGFSVALGLLGEMLLHPFRMALLAKLTRVGTVGLGLACLAGQMIYYSFLWSWWSVLPVQILSALSHGALWWAVEAWLEDLATPGTERSLRAMFQGHLYRGGSSLGSIVAGFVVMHSGLAVLYRACAVALLLWLALFLAIQARLPREQRINYSKLLTMEMSDSSDSEEGTERDWLVKAMREEHSGRTD
ncbi:major facilitator superfamily domain-containing protein 6-like [Echinops telfairi]|uniref:Major facilitator superfamily domain-containing protein 6-like n=1 Tax=Echinops telfairi TaxID=9371 RepID=A0ABM0J210_ECHTE|nr:major facilitator superfamily domain-containing protein 6-like [Echinops telfairi]